MPVSPPGWSAGPVVGHNGGRQQSKLAAALMVVVVVYIQDYEWLSGRLLIIPPSSSWHPVGVTHTKEEGKRSRKLDARKKNEPVLRACLSTCKLILNAYNKFSKSICIYGKKSVTKKS